MRTSASPIGSRSRAHFSTSSARRRQLARPLVPRAFVRARPLQHLEVAALRRARARRPVPREILRAAQRLQRLEISIPRSGSAQETLVRQSTSSAQTLERAQVSALGGIVLTELLNLPPGRVHRVAHPVTHRAKHREVRGIGQVVFNERHGDIEDKARDRYSRLSVDVQLPHARARLGVTRRIIDHLGLCRVHRARRCVVVRAAPEIGATRKSSFVSRLAKRRVDGTSRSQSVYVNPSDDCSRPQALKRAQNGECAARTAWWSHARHPTRVSRAAEPRAPRFGLVRGRARARHPRCRPRHPTTTSRTGSR